MRAIARRWYQIAAARSTKSINIHDRCAIIKASRRPNVWRAERPAAISGGLQPWPALGEPVHEREVGSYYSNWRRLHAHRCRTISSGIHAQGSEPEGSQTFRFCRQAQGGPDVLSA